MPRKPVGIAAIQQKKKHDLLFQNKGKELASEQIKQLTSQVELFRGNLETYAVKHRDNIRKDPVFRFQFQEMCSKIGVDPLASNKGYWSQLLGVGDFYYEVCVQVIEICLSTAPMNGGLISLSEMKRRLLKSRNRSAIVIGSNDILASIKTLKVLKSGFSVIKIKDSKDDPLIQSVPMELNMDHSHMISLAQKDGYFTVGMCRRDLKWDDKRINLGVEFLIKQGLAWVDSQAAEGTRYYVVSAFTNNSTVT